MAVLHRLRVTIYQSSECCRCFGLTHSAIRLSVLDRGVRSRRQLPAKRQELVEALQEEWQRIPRDVIRRLTFSGRRRVFAYIEAGGGHARY